MDYAIEMNDGIHDKRYGVVHRKGCAHLIDGLPLGTDWRDGVAALGTDWEMDLEDGLLPPLAPCAAPTGGSDDE